MAAPTATPPDLPGVQLLNDPGAQEIPSDSTVTKPYPKLDVSRIAEIARWLPEKPVGLAPDSRDRKAFDALAALPVNANAVRDAEALIKTPIPAWNDALYLEYSRTGQRKPGEAMIGARRSRLAPLVWAECLENRGRFLPHVEEALLAYVAEPTWTWPAHDGKLNNFNRSRYSVDLISATFAAELANTLYLLGDRLKPAVREAVLAALRERVWNPVFAALSNPTQPIEATTESYWLNTTNNWSAVCLAGVTGSALAALPDRNERAVMVAAAEVYVSNFIQGFTDDGYCTEGISYWNYGFGHFIVLRTALYAGTEGRIDLFSNPKVRAMALFGPRMEVQPGVFPAISDCGFETRINTALLAFCDQTLGLGLNLEVPAKGGLRGRITESLVYQFGLFPSANASTGTTGTKPGRELRSFFPDAGILICRPATGGRLGVVLKGGSNNEHHNHNDVGSFTLVVGKGQPVGDPGGPPFYNDETFGPLRYTKFEVFRSRNHAVPLLAGSEQSPGPGTNAVVLRSDFTPESDYFSLDLKAAYKIPELRTINRSFIYSREAAGGLEVRDDFAFTAASSFETSLTTHGTWKRTGPRSLEFTHRNETVAVSIETPCDFDITEQEIKETAHPFIRVGIKLRKPLLSGTVIMRFTPAAAAQL